MKVIGAYWHTRNAGRFLSHMPQPGIPQALRIALQIMAFGRIGCETASKTLLWTSAMLSRVTPSTLNLERRFTLLVLRILGCC